jgi:uncharacterized protein
VIFVDTGPLIARHVERDQFHESAVAHWLEVEASGRRCFTSNFVLCEAITLLARRTTYEFAAARAESLMASSVLAILRADETDERDALALVHKYADQRVSFTDCISFILMDKLGIDSVFTYDHHFSIAGFTVEP